MELTIKCIKIRSEEYSRLTLSSAVHVQRTGKYVYSDVQGNLTLKGNILRGNKFINTMMVF